MVYADESVTPYLTKQGVANLRSAFAKDIFAQDLLCVYQKQTEHRDELRLRSKEVIAEIVGRINSGAYDNPKLEELLLQLADRLSKTKGKKQYGYLKADVKAIINRIVSELAADERIAALYELWYEQREEVLRTYTQEMPDRIPLVDNPEFKSIKNAVIQEAMRITAEPVTVEEPVELTTTGDAHTGPQAEEAEPFGCAPLERDLPGQPVDHEPQPHPSGIQAHREGSAAMGAVRLLYYISRMIRNRLEDERNGKHGMADRKLRRQIEEKKEAHGLKQG